MLALESAGIVQCFPDLLKQVEQEKWTGILDVNKGGDRFGTVFLHQGQIAWATCKDQSKNLGFFLEKIGMIPKQQQKEIFDKLKTLGSCGDFSALIEQTGLISRSKLRECLREHIHSAISSLLVNKDVTFNQKQCNISATPELLFLADEVLRTEDAQLELTQDATLPCPSEFESSEPVTEINGILESLESLTGYQYSFICNSEAKVLAAHKSESLPWDLNEILTASTDWIVSSAAKLHELRIGRMEFVLVEHDQGSLIARCPTLENEFFIAASFNENGKPGVIKHKISEMASSVNTVME